MLADAETALATNELGANAFLSALVGQFGVDAVQRGALDALGYPATLVGTHVEAIAILEFLKTKPLGD